MFLKIRDKQYISVGSDTKSPNSGMFWQFTDSYSKLITSEHSLFPHAAHGYVNPYQASFAPPRGPLPPGAIPPPGYPPGPGYAPGYQGQVWQWLQEVGCTYTNIL